jgi:hypothetical protein
MATKDDVVEAARKYEEVCRKLAGWDRTSAFSLDQLETAHAQRRQELLEVTRAHIAHAGSTNVVIEPATETSKASNLT